LTPSQGSDAASIPVLVEPVAAYQFAFDIATLNQPATLTFDIEIAALDAAGQSALLAALASDSLTLAVRGDAPGSAFQTFALCNGQLPSAGGCADVARLDASGNVILPGDATVPTTVRVTGVAGSFSTYAVAIATQIPDTTPPVIADVPAPITAEAASAAGAAVTYSAPTALDDYDGVVAVGCMPASGSLFSLGSTTVTCVAVDAASNGSSSSFTVTVVDTTPPALTCPANQTLTATSASGAIATYPPATVADAVDTAPAVTYSRASGALFPVGATSVTATATDAASNSSTCAFTVTVEPPAPVGADLSLTSAVSPDPATLGSPVTYNVTVRNHGPDEATDVRMAHVLLANVRFVSATSSQGQCLGILGVVACDLDTLGSGATVTVTIVVIPRARGTLMGAAYGLSAVTDPNLANNWAAATTRVR
jgi:uncharacterized repeat protein (TIGR01451 family)